ncbi:MAG: hypothetical protein ABL962_06540, partial [Fimbriimonadaceae bacterium]
MPIPALLTQPEAWMESSGIVAYLDSDIKQQVELESYISAWGILVGQAPDKAFEIMAGDAARTGVETIDILRFRASRGAWPGSRLPEPPAKNLWAALHGSGNPCYRLIALEYFDSVNQTPDELLSLYEECLLKGCSYLEVRALEAISANEDRRQAVVRLLRQYASTRNIVNDGTLHLTRSHFEGQTPQQAAVKLADSIQSKIDADGERPPAYKQAPALRSSATDKPAAVAPNGPVVNQSKATVSSQSDYWFAWVVIWGAA